MSTWETLGIEETTDERAIKRAYAKQLKNIRPDEDPVYFQKLREARDDAIFHAKYSYTWNDDDWEEEDDDELEQSSETDALATDIVETIPQPSGPPLQENSEVEHPPIEAKETVELTKTAEASEAVADDNPTPVLEPDKPEKTIELPSTITSTDFLATANKDAYILTIDDPQPSNGSEELPSQEIGHQNTNEQTEAPRNFHDLEVDDITHDDIDNELEILFSPWCQWDMEQWKNFIHKARECTFDLSTYTEFEILGALSDHFENKPKLNEYERAKRDYILSYLNEEYGWTQNDRRIYSILTDEQADQLMDQIRSTGSEDWQPQKESFYDTIGFPILTAEHFKNFLGKNDTKYEKYYQTCLRKGHSYQKSWSWLGFIFSPLWLAHRCNDGLEALVSISYIIALIVAYHGQKTENFWLLMGAIATIFAMHLFTGIYGKRLVISTMASSLTELAIKPGTEEENLKKMASIGRGGIRGIYDLVAGMLGIALILGVIYQIFFAP